MISVLQLLNFHSAMSNYDRDDVLSCIARTATNMDEVLVVLLELQRRGMMSLVVLLKLLQYRDPYLFSYFARTPAE